MQLDEAHGLKRSERGQELSKRQWRALEQDLEGARLQEIEIQEELLLDREGEVVDIKGEVVATSDEHSLHLGVELLALRAHGERVRGADLGEDLGRLLAAAGSGGRFV